MPAVTEHVPPVHGHCDARAVAALYGIFARRGRCGDRRILPPEAAERVREGQGACRDRVVGAGFAHETELGLGLWLSGPSGRTAPVRARSATTATAAWPTRRRGSPSAAS